MALADMYGGQHTTMSMLVSSGHPEKAGLQVALVETLIDFGAALEARGSGEWTSPLSTALAFGTCPPRRRSCAAARALRRSRSLPALDGSRMPGDYCRPPVRSIAIAPRRWQRNSDTSRFFGCSLTLAKIRIVTIRKAITVTRPRSIKQPGPDTMRSVRMLVERGARLDIKDTIDEGTPLGWAEYGGRTRRLPNICVRSKGTP